MISTDEIKQTAIDTINTEAEAIEKLTNYIDSDFINAVKNIYNSKGRLIITGIGKSANIANKIVATLNSTGTPAVFMHAADAIHGDLGIILKNDIVLCISKSGNTPEIKSLIPIIKNSGNQLIAMVSNTESYLANQADLVLKAHVEREACPNNLAPTSSTTAQLVIGDALAVCLLKMKGFSNEDFARFHPGGTLGKRLYTRISDILKKEQNPSVNLYSSIKNVIIEISEKRLGATTVINDNGDIEGIITDGDIRRMLKNNTNLEKLQAKDIMNNSPKTIDINTLAIKAFNIMEDFKITQLIVTENNQYKGIIHLHNILDEGIV
jgi:arabinose-5-phosphate isomerase